ncbi:hypothetical protein JCM5350_006540 [Sporobolomyces pararoseus]
MRQSTTLLSLATLLLGAMSVSAQTATTLSEEMNQLAVVIPEACVALCTPWQQAYQQCPVASDATTDYSLCLCASEFVNNFNACTGCMANTLNAQGDTVNAGVATQAPTDLANYCNAAGISESSSSSTTSSTTSSTSTTDPAATTTSVSSSTDSSSSSSSTSSSSTSSVVAGVAGPAVAGGPFPSQTKQPSAFSNGGNAIKLSGGVFVGLFMAMVML